MSARARRADSVAPRGRGKGLLPRLTATLLSDVAESTLRMSGVETRPASTGAAPPRSLIVFAPTLSSYLTQKCLPRDYKHAPSATQILSFFSVCARATVLMSLRVGILTGGGDCPGLNAVIRAVVRRASSDHDDSKILGIKNGWTGLIEDDVEHSRDNPSPASSARRHDPRHLPRQPGERRSLPGQHQGHLAEV